MSVASIIVPNDKYILNPRGLMINLASGARNKGPIDHYYREKMVT